MEFATLYSLYRFQSPSINFGTVAVICISLLLAGCPQIDFNRAPHELDEKIYAGKINWLSLNIPALNYALMACALQEAERNNQAIKLQQTQTQQQQSP